MTNKENVIIWEKWRDPFGEVDEDISPNDGLGEFLDDNHEEDEEDSDQLINDNSFKTVAKQVKVIATPMGIVPINENTASGKIFNFWTGHTNFDITKGVFNILETVDGVETLDVFTRYRFRIGIGKAFTDSYVMNNIQNSIYEYLENNYANQKNKE
jgi:hypothetical protein